MLWLILAARDTKQDRVGGHAQLCSQHGSLRMALLQMLKCIISATPGPAPSSAPVSRACRCARARGSAGHYTPGTARSGAAHTPCASAAAEIRVFTYVASLIAAVPHAGAGMRDSARRHAHAVFVTAGAHTASGHALFVCVLLESSSFTGGVARDLRSLAAKRTMEAHACVLPTLYTAEPETLVPLRHSWLLSPNMHAYA